MRGKLQLCVVTCLKVFAAYRSFHLFFVTKSTIHDGLFFSFNRLLEGICSLFYSRLTSVANVSNFVPRKCVLEVTMLLGSLSNS